MNLRNQDIIDLSEESEINDNEEEKEEDPEEIIETPSEIETLTCKLLFDKNKLKNKSIFLKLSKNEKVNKDNKIIENDITLNNLSEKKSKKNSNISMKNKNKNFSQRNKFLNAIDKLENCLRIFMEEIKEIKEDFKEGKNSSFLLSKISSNNNSKEKMIEINTSLLESSAKIYSNEDNDNENDIYYGKNGENYEISGDNKDKSKFNENFLSAEIDDSFNDYYKNNKSYVYIGNKRVEFDDRMNCEEEVEIKKMEKMSGESVKKYENVVTSNSIEMEKSSDISNLVEIVINNSKGKNKS